MSESFLKRKLCRISCAKTQCVRLTSPWLEETSGLRNCVAIMCSYRRFKSGPFRSRVPDAWARSRLPSGTERDNLIAAFLTDEKAITKESGLLKYWTKGVVAA